MRLITLVLLTMLFVSQSHAQDNKLRVTPSKCVALKKGQICYQSIRIRYESLEVRDYCLTVSNRSDPLQCWSDTDMIDYRYRFASSEALEFKIIDANGTPLASANFNVAWVYKQSKIRNRWRLF